MTDDPPKPKPLLVISYLFPPVGGAGVQRITKFVKYLPEMGWQPLILTVSNPSVPVLDDSLLGDLPESTIVYRARTWEPGYATKKAVSAAQESSRGRLNPFVFTNKLLRKLGAALLQPDPQILWLPGAFRQACRIIPRHRPHLILVTAPPFSTFLLGARLARRFGLPLVLDYRDEWDISNSSWENRRPGRLSLAIQEWMQAYAMRSAAAVIATTRRSQDVLQSRARECLGGTHESQFLCIHNGFDAEDFLGRSERPQGIASSGYFKFVYLGTLWNLTSVEPLVIAIRRFAEHSPELAKKLELHLIGRRTVAQDELLDSLAHTPIKLTRESYVEHGNALRHICCAQVLVLLLSNDTYAGRVVPGKLFEYIATGNPILAIVPDGEVREILAEYPLAHCFSPEDSEGIAQGIERIMREQAPSTMAETGTDSEILSQRYERKVLTEKLARLFDELDREQTPSIES